MPLRSALVLLSLLSTAATARPALECVTIASVDGAVAALVTDAACTVAAHPLMATEAPDLAFGPPLCFVTTFSGKLTIDGRATDGFDVVAYSGVTTAASGAALAVMPPLLDGEGNPRPLIPFAAATVIEVRASAGGKVVGQLVTRDTGWGELGLTSALPVFASERLVITRGTGKLFDGARGEIVFSGDQFGAGGVARGSVCAPRMRRRVQKVFR